MTITITTTTTTSPLTNSTILPTSAAVAPFTSVVNTADATDIVRICKRIGVILDQLKNDESPLFNSPPSQMQDTQASETSQPANNPSVISPQVPPPSLSSGRLGIAAKTDTYKNTINDIAQLLDSLSQNLLPSTDTNSDINSRDNTRIAEELEAVLQMLSASKEGMNSLVEEISNLQTETAYPNPLSPSLTQRLISCGAVMAVIFAIVVLVAASMTSVTTAPVWLSSTLTLGLAMTPQLIQQVVHLIDIKRTHAAQSQAQGQAQSKMQLWQLEKWLNRLQNQLQLTHQKTQQELTIARQKQEIIELKRTVDSLIKTIDNFKNIPIISKSLNTNLNPPKRKTISRNNR